MPSDIHNKIKEAMRSACEDMFRFSGERAKPINAEYLFTVAVAKQIDKLNGYFGDPYKIYLEKSRKDFSKDCLLPVKFGNRMTGKPTLFREKEPKITSKERIDIAVYQDIPNNSYLGPQPICAIEVKGFNPNRKLVLKDLKRNLQYFSITGNTGNSVLKQSLFAALHYWEKIGGESEESKRIKEIEDRYKSWLSELGQTSHVDTRVTAYSISKDIHGEVVDEGEDQVLDTDTIHHFVGVIVEFCLNKT